MTDGARGRERIGDEQFRALLEAAPDAMVIVDERGTIVLVNSQTERLFGYERGEILAQAVELLIPARFRSSHVGHRTAYAEEPHVRPMGAGLTLFGQRKDGSEFPVEISLSPLETPGGRLITAAIRDVTERKRVEQILIQKNTELEHAVLTKDRFLGSMSHELRTPLNAIIGFTGTLLMQLPGPLTTDQEAQLRTVQRSARHLLTLINDLLDLAKVESGKVALRLEPVSCGEVVDDVIGKLSWLAAERKLELGTSPPAGDLVVRTDRRVLTQILQTLTASAMAFTDAGRIELGAASDGDAARIVVAADSAGLTAPDRQRLSDAFGRAEAVHPEGGDPVGLGWYLSRRLAELVQASISVAAAEPHGCRFSIVLPAIASPVHVHRGRDHGQ